MNQDLELPAQGLEGQLGAGRGGDIVVANGFERLEGFVPTNDLFGLGYEECFCGVVIDYVHVLGKRSRAPIAERPAD